MSGAADSAADNALRIALAKDTVQTPPRDLAARIAKNRSTPARSVLKPARPSMTRSREGGAGSMSSSREPTATAETDRPARGLQPAQSQHDDLARIPCHPALVKAAIEGRLPSRHRSYSPLRHAGRMVAPAPGARSASPITPLSRTCLRNCRLCFRETGIRGQRTGRPRRTSVARPHLQRRAGSREEPARMRGFSSAWGNLRTRQECVVGPGGLEPPTRPL